MKKKFNLTKFADSLAFSLDQDAVGISTFKQGKFTAKLYYPSSSYAVKLRARQLLYPKDRYHVTSNVIGKQVDKALQLYGTYELAIETIKRHLQIQGEDLDPRLVIRAQVLINRLRYEKRLKDEKEKEKTA